MAASFKKTTIKTVPRVGEKVTSDTLYWKNLETPVTKKEFGPITNIEFSPVEPYSFAVTNSTRVQIYSARSLQILKTISRFHQVTYSGTFRDDGKLLIAGGDEGVIRLFDVESKSLLRLFKGHDGPVRTCRFMKDNVHLFSGSDDNTVCVWDIPSEKDILTYRENKDYVRCGVASAASHDIIVTGSYDHTVKMFDTRLPESVMTLDHGFPVESVLMFPTGGIFISAGGNVVKVWDALAGGKLLATMCDHQKQVMSLGFCSNYKRLLTASLDRHVKIYDVGTYQVVHTLDYPGSLLSVAVAPDDSLLVAGTVEGLVSIQKRTAEDMPVKKKKTSNFKYKIQSRSHVPEKSDVVVHHKKKEILPKYDKYLKKFDYTKAFDTAMDIRTVQQNPQVTISVIQELARRGGLQIALAGRDEKSLGIVLKFITMNLKKPSFHSTLIDLGLLVLDMYSDKIGQSSALGTHLLNLRNAVDKEVRCMKEFFTLMGQLDTLFTAAQTEQVTKTSSKEKSSETLVPTHAALAAS